MESSRTKKIIAVCLLAVGVVAFLSCFPGKDSKGEADDFIFFQELNTGDLIFRRGKGVISEIARNFSRKDRRFSHVGIVVKNSEGMVVVHSIDDDSKGFYGVVVEGVQGYLSDIEDWAVYRLDADDMVRRGIAVLALNMVAEGVPFDNEFNLESTDRLYCTEFIWQVVNRVAGKELIVPKTERLGRIFVSIDDVYLNEHVSLVVQSKPD